MLAVVLGFYSYCLSASSKFSFSSQVAAEQSVELGDLSTSTSEEIIVPSPTLSIPEELRVSVDIKIKSIVL